MMRWKACIVLVTASLAMSGCGGSGDDASDRCEELAPGANRAANSYMDDSPIGDDADPDQMLSDYDDYQAFQDECMD